MSVVRKQTVFVDTPGGLKPQVVHPETEVKAIVDFGDALDGYRETFIDPKIKEIQLLPLSFPIGYIFPWAFKTPPTGCLKLNGSELNRSIYNKLWEVVEADGPITEAAWQTRASAGTSVGVFSSGDGSTTFRLPKIVDFIRGLPSGQTLGNFVSDAIRNINGGFTIRMQRGPNAGIWTSVNAPFASDGTEIQSYPTITVGTSAQTVRLKFDASLQVPTAAENRPKHVMFEYYIKAFNADLGTMALNDLLPVGTIFYTSSQTAPDGSLKANGATLDRVIYGKLFSVIGTIYGSDGSTTFKIPDIRGEFLRSLDDGRGIDNSRTLGSTQGDAMRNFPGRLYVRYANWASATGSVLSTGPFVEDPTEGTQTIGSSSTTGKQSLNFDPSKVVPTANENRPRNVALLACIKY